MMKIGIPLIPSVLLVTASPILLVLLPSRLAPLLPVLLTPEVTVSPTPDVVTLPVVFGVVCMLVLCTTDWLVLLSYHEVLGSPVGEGWVKETGLVHDVLEVSILDVCGGTVVVGGGIV